MSEIKKRRLYQYPCVQCGRKAQSFMAERAIDQLCRICRKNQPDPNQDTLFDSIENKEKTK